MLVVLPLKTTSLGAARGWAELQVTAFRGKSSFPAEAGTEGKARRKAGSLTVFSRYLGLETAWGMCVRAAFLEAATRGWLQEAEEEPPHPAAPSSFLPACELAVREGQD